jgi:hypothetical protein
MAAAKPSPLVIVSFVAGCVACLWASTLFSFAAYGPTLKEQINVTQTELNLVASLSDFGLYAGIGVGLFYEATSPLVTMLCGSFLVGLSYALLGLAVLRILLIPTWVLYVFGICIGQGSFAIYTAAYAPSVHNIDVSRRALVMSSFLACNSASAVVVALLFKYAFWGVDSTPAQWATFFFALGGIITGTTVVCAFVVRKRPPPPPTPPEKVSDFVTVPARTLIDLCDGYKRSISRFLFSCKTVCGFPTLWFFDSITH